MAESSFPFDSVGSDREYGASDFAAFSHLIRGDKSGISYDVGSRLAVTHLGLGVMQIASGGAVIRGYTYRNSSTLTKNLSSLATGYKRYDRIVLRLDTVTARSIVVTVVEGVAAVSSPTIPSLDSDDIELATVYLDNPSGTTSYTVTDAREYLFDYYAKKMAVETKYEIGSVHPLLYHKPPVVWDATSNSTVNAYNPAIDLSAIDDYQIIDSTGTSSGLTSQPITKIVAPDFVSWLRAFKVTARRGMATEKSAFTLSTWAVSGGTTATLVFASDADLVAALTAWGEDALVAGASDDLMTYTPDYTKSALLNIPSTLSSGGSSIPAGDYVLTSNNPATREVQFTIPATSNISATATSVQCSFYPFRLVGETGKARIFASQGRVLQGANDGLTENFSGFRRRGRIKGHHHSLIGGIKDIPGVQGSGDRIARGFGEASAGLSDFYLAKNIGPDASNGPVVVGPETDSRSTIVHFHVGIGSLEV